MSLDLNQDDDDIPGGSNNGLPDGLEISLPTENLNIDENKGKQ